MTMVVNHTPPRKARWSLLFSFAVVVAACGGTSGGSGFGDGDAGSSSGGGSGGGSGGSSGGSGGSSGGIITGDGGIIGSGGDGSIGDAGCATATAKATKKPVYLEFILDGSGSMSQNNKWTAATAALKAVFGTVQAAVDTGEGIGLMVFSDSKDPTHASGPYPDSADVPINFVGAAQVSALDNRVSGMPFLDTPTGTALQGGYSYLEGFTPLTPLPPGGQKVLVLITDGVPTDNCSTGGSASNPCVMEAAAEFAKTAPQGPILTFVIGTGVFPSTDTSNYDPTFLGYLAQAGGSAPNGCNPAENSNVANICYFNVDPTAGNATQTEMAFETAINAIRGQVVSCTFPLTSTGTIDPNKVNVTVDGMTVPQDPTNGWTYDNPSNPTSITLHGTSCTDLKNNPNASVEIVLGCATQKPQ